MPIKDIAFIVKYFPTVSETFIVNQINGLLEAGYKIDLFAYNKVEATIIHESLKKYNLLNSVKYFIKPPKSKFGRLFVFLKWTIVNFSKLNWQLYFKSINIFKYGKEALTLKLFYESQWFLVSKQYAIIHSHFGMNGNRIAYLKARGILPKKTGLITTFHGYDLVPLMVKDYSNTYAFLFKYTDVFTVNSPYLKGILEQINKFEKLIYLLPVGLDVTFFRRKLPKQNSTRFNLVFCGKLIPLKGPDIAVDVVKILKYKGYSQVFLKIIGNGEMRPELENLVHDYELKEAVCFYGAQSQEEVKQHFENADVFILPGRYELKTGRGETQGLVIQEAEAMELPVIVSDVGGMKYGLVPNESGFVVAENDLNGYVKVIEKLILNPELKLKMGQNGRAFVIENYDNRVLVERLSKIYKRIIDNI
jgi:colanic acid/amylovoran biosynthesis glycosyltransferase